MPVWAMTEAPVRHMLLPMILGLWLTLKIYGSVLAKVNLGANLTLETFKKSDLYQTCGKRKPQIKNLPWPDMKMSLTNGLFSWQNEVMV
jgi:hypothetical protein